MSFYPNAKDRTHRHKPFHSVEHLAKVFLNPSTERDRRMASRAHHGSSIIRFVFVVAFVVNIHLGRRRVRFRIFLSCRDIARPAERFRDQTNVPRQLTLHRIIAQNGQDLRNYKNPFIIHAVPGPNAIALAVAEVAPRSVASSAIHRMRAHRSCSTIPSSISSGGAMLEVERKWVLYSWCTCSRGRQGTSCLFQRLLEFSDVSSRYIESINVTTRWARLSFIAQVRKGLVKSRRVLAISELSGRRVAATIG